MRSARSPPPTGCGRRRDPQASTPSTPSSTSCLLVTWRPPDPIESNTGKESPMSPSSRPMLRGAFTALVTPFLADGRVDEAAFRRLVRWQVLAGIDGLVPCGTTGEAPTLTPAEREWLIATTVETVAAATFLRLAEHPRVIAVKEASGQLEQIARICRERPRDVAVLAGDDAWTLPMLAIGADGVVSVASNEIPGELVALCASARAGDWDAARRTHERWLPLFLANFRGAPNPVPAKAALALMGLLDDDAVRAPLLRLDDEARSALAVTLRGLGLVEAAGGRIGETAREAVA